MKEERERPPLRVILQNFINHVENLEAYRRENSYEKEFQDLKLFSEDLKTVGEYSCKEGEKEINRKKNRYKDILPFDYTRVTLSEYVGVPGSDYINANYIKGASGSPAYIASQGPLPHTVNDFWRMVVECEVQVIVMACNEEESGKHKCENYWVEKEGEEKKFGMATIRLLKASTICPDFLVRTMQLKYMNAQSILEERVVCQFHYGAWPDHGVPGLVRPLLEMVRLVRDTQASETLPVLVHCSAGCGRTGTICAIDYVWGLLRAGKLKLDFSLFQLVRDMRKQRIAMVQTKDQYILVHQAVKELFQDQLRMINSHPYENIDIRGLPIVPAMSSKAVILCPGQTSILEEKQDSREKDSSVTSSSVSTEEAIALANPVTSDAPPLPHKKRIHIISSKQEKEVENLTQRQLAMATASGSANVPFPVNLVEPNGQAVSKNVKIISAKPVPTPAPMTASSHSQMSGSACCLPQPSSFTQADGLNDTQKPSIAKLKALFESNPSVKAVGPNNVGNVVAKPRLPQLVTRSHSLGAVRKPQKFSQFTSGALENIGQPPLSSDLCESERYKSASNAHVDLSCPTYQGVEMCIDNPPVKVESMSNSNVPNCVYDTGPESAPYFETISCDPTKSIPIAARKSVPSSVVLASSFKHENSSHPLDMQLTTHFLPETPRPALPIKRSKSLKAKMSGETFKLSLSKRDYGQSQVLPTSERCSISPSCNVVEGKPEVKSLSKASRGYEILVKGDKDYTSKIAKVNMSLKSLNIPSSEAGSLKEASVVVVQRPDIGEVFSKVSINSGASDPKVGLISPPSVNKSSIDIEQFSVSSEKKKVENVSKPNCDVCRAQSLNLKREKSSLALKTFSQESQYVNLKTFNATDSTKYAKEPVKCKSKTDKIGDTKAPLQTQISLPIDASSVYEHCSDYLKAEGVDKPSATESQRIAAASARHKVDTVVGGLGIRERRNSFRRAVGQGVDDKRSISIKMSKVGKWPPSSNESYSLPHPEANPLKKQFEHQSINSAVRHESEEALMFDPSSKELSERNKGAEGNVMFKGPPPGVQKFPLVSECKYLKSVQKPSENFGEASDVQKQILPKMPESSPSSSDIVQKRLKSNKKTVSDSSSFHPPNPPWMHSVGNGDKKAAQNPVMHNSNTSDALFSPSKRSNDSNEPHLWPTQHFNNVPLKKGSVIDAPYSLETLGPQLNPNLVVPLEVDVDQVGASMRHNFQEKAEGSKTSGVLENSNPGNSGASTHFTRALEVFQQTAASIRTKFSWSAGSGSSSPKSSEPSPKTSPVAPSQPQYPKAHQNGGRRKGERSIPSVSDKPKILKKQQQYL